MASRGYDGATTPVVEPLTREQRQRLEALTFARKLVGYKHDVNEQPVSMWLRLAEYIVSGSDAVESPRLLSPRSVALTVTVLWDLAVLGGVVRWYRNYRRRMR